MRQCLLVGALLVGSWWAILGAAGAQPAVIQVDLNADQRSLVIQLTAERAVTLIREHRRADEAQERFYERLAAKDQALRVSQVHAAGNAAELARVRKARDEIARQREALIAAVEQRDRTLAAELSAYREEVTKLASSPDPQKQKALQRFADGEQHEALDDLDLIADAKRAAHDKAVVIADAAERRPTAWLAVQALDAGKVTLDKVVERFEKLTWLDAGVTDDWIELGRLYSQQGRLAEVQKANESALRSLAASDERTWSVVLNELGNVAIAAGDLAGAKARYEEALAIRRKLAEDNPISAVAQRDLSLSLEKLGNVTVAAGDLSGAKARHEESLTIVRRLAKDNPTSAVAQRDLSIILAKLGDVAVAACDLPGAKARYEEGLDNLRKLVQDTPTSTEAQRDLSIILAKLGDVAVAAGDLSGAKARYEEGLGIVRKLGKGNPTSAEAQRDLSISLGKLGDVAFAVGDLSDAKVRYEEDLDIVRQLAKHNPTSAVAQRDLSISLNNLGNVAVAAGDMSGARALYEECLVILRKLAKDNQTSAEAQRDLAVSLGNLGAVTQDCTLLHEALQIAQSLEQAGRLAPRDHGLIEVITQSIAAVPWPPCYWHSPTNGSTTSVTCAACSRSTR
jgi:tetratricopeptide (TPR) repeat protein